MKKKGSQRVFAENLKRIRESKGMSQKELGLLLGFGDEYPQQRLSQYENWQSEKARFPRPELIDKIAQIFGVNLSDLFYDYTTEGIGRGGDATQDSRFQEEKAKEKERKSA